MKVFNQKHANLEFCVHVNVIILKMCPKYFQKTNYTILLNFKIKDKESAFIEKYEMKGTLDIFLCDSPFRFLPV